MGLRESHSNDCSDLHQTKPLFGTPHTTERPFGSGKPNARSQFPSVATEHLFGNRRLDLTEQPFEVDPVR